MSSTPLSPLSATHSALSTGAHHLTMTPQITFLKNLCGAFLLSSGGLVSLTLYSGIPPALHDTSPALPRLLQTLGFPLGLVLVYTLGADLYTGYPMYYSLTALSRRGRPLSYITGALSSYLGNLTGALLAALLAHAGQLYSSPLFAEGIRLKLESSILEPAWQVVFVRACWCGVLVSLAMFFGTLHRDAVGRFLGLALPFAVCLVAEMPHTVEYMFVGAVALGLRMEGLGVGTYVGKVLVPVVLGNTVGGVVFGVWLWWVYLVCGGEKKGAGEADGMDGVENGDAERYRD